MNENSTTAPTDPSATIVRQDGAGDMLGNSSPLVLDLDGTVLRTDLLLESLILAIKKDPWVLLICPFWLMQGRAAFKRRIADRAGLRVDLLPLNTAVVDYAAECHSRGRKVFIATAADEALARDVADRLGFVEETLSSDGARNLKGQVKAALLAERFPGGFAYVGDSAADIPVWRASSAAVFAGRSPRVLRRAERGLTFVERLPAPTPSVKTWVRALRLHQWSKNALVFMPLFLAGLVFDASAWLDALLAVFAIGMLSSSTYLLNDLLDLESDRAHWSKSRRPLASGDLPIHYALVAGPTGVVLGLGLGWAAGGLAGLLCLLAYLAITVAYSMRLKRLPIVDVLIIASLFTLRLLLGAVVVDAPIRPWLFVFSMFIFTALSMAKRAAELQRIGGEPGARLNGRGYVAQDLTVIAGFGVAASAAAVLVLVLYILEDAFSQGFYASPHALWMAPVLLTLWLGRVWLICGRGELDDDPVAFAVKDRASLMLAAALGVVMLAAMFL